MVRFGDGFFSNSWIGEPRLSQFEMSLWCKTGHVVWKSYVARECGYNLEDRYSISWKYESNNKISEKTVHWGFWLLWWLDDPVALVSRLGAHLCKMEVLGQAGFKRTSIAYHLDEKVRNRKAECFDCLLGILVSLSSSRSLAAALVAEIDQFVIIKKRG